MVADTQRDRWCSFTRDGHAFTFSVAKLTFAKSMGKEIISINISDGAWTGRREGWKALLRTAAQRAITLLLNVITPEAADCTVPRSKMIHMWQMMIVSLGMEMRERLPSYLRFEA